MKPTLTCTLAQYDIHWEDKAANFLQIETYLKTMDKIGQLLILPEMFATGFSVDKVAQLSENEAGITFQWMKKIAVQYKTIVVGSMIFEENKQYFNRLIWMLPSGDYGKYDKRHLFSFAQEGMYFQAGNKRLVAQANGWKCNLQICYDLRFPVWIRQNPVEENFEYDVLIMIANWPKKRIEAWKTLLKARAIENQIYVIGVNRIGIDANEIAYNGETCIIAPSGEELLNLGDENIITNYVLQKEILENHRNRFLFWKDRDDFLLLKK